MSWAKWVKSLFLEREKRKWVWLVLSFTIITVILITSFFPLQRRLEAGDIARTDIEAHQTMMVVDEEQTEALRQEVARRVPNVFEEDEEVVYEVKDNLDVFFSQFLPLEDDQEDISEEAGIIEVPNEEQADEKIAITAGLEDEDIHYLTRLSAAEILQLQERAEEILLQHLNQGVRSTHIEEVRKQISEEIGQMDISPQEENILIQVTHVFLKPNIILNEEATERRRQEALDELDPVKKTIQQGEVIVRHGQVITEDDIDLLGKLGLLRPTINLRNIIGLAAITFIIMFGSGLYLKSYHRDLIRDESSIILLSLLPVFLMILGRLAGYLAVNEPGFLIPVAVGSILVAILLDSRAALFLTIGFSFLTMMIIGGGMSHLTVAIAGSVTGVYSVSKVSQRTDFVRAGFIVGIVCAITIAAFTLAENAHEPAQVLKLSGLGIINGILTAILINGLLPLLENYMGMTSSVKLLELSNPNQPLLKKLLMEAPGTYHHSVIVGNLAEAAADRLGADSLLVRVGAYYHDVGKIKRPYFFSENILGGGNPHDKLNNSLSALIIKSHVKDGVDLARKYRIPDPIVDIIQQHHGTSFISYFYQEAQQKEPDLDESNFRYDGPKPTTKEAALIMLADVIEAAVRSRPEERSNPQLLEAMIHEIIREKLEQGQMDQCDLTLRDMEPIGDCFAKILIGIYHKRVEYPGQAEIREEDINGTTNIY